MHVVVMIRETTHKLDLHDQNMVDYDDGKLPLPGRPVSATGISPEARIPLLEPMPSSTSTEFTHQARACLVSWHIAVSNPVNFRMISESETLMGSAQLENPECYER